MDQVEKKNKVEVLIVVLLLVVIAVTTKVIWNNLYSKEKGVGGGIGTGGGLGITTTGGGVVITGSGFRLQLPAKKTKKTNNQAKFYN